ncbi:MAG: hypothetical protein JXR69_00330 [Candidatus Delongbacteria bacterium]|nr:hypothetical protein [Candidatus Delongbacteria bacterium]
MKKILAYISLIILIGTFVYWVTPKIQHKGIKKIKNEYFTDPVELKLEKICSIDSTEINKPVQSYFNSKDELYVLEYFSQKVKIFDQKGKLIRKYENICDSSNISSFTLFNDTLFVSCLEDKSFRTINEKGEVLRKVLLNDELPLNISFINENNILGLFRTNLVKGKELYINLDLKLVDKNFSKKKLISSFFSSMYQMNFDPEITMFPFAISRFKDLLYLGVSSPEKYSIFVYDIGMKLQFVVENSADSIYFTQDEFKLKLKRAKEFKLPLSKSLELKDNIENMFCDELGNIWVRRGIDNNKYSFDTSIFDIFRYNGKYLKSILLKNTSRIGDISIHGDKVVVLNPEISKVDVYKINLQEIVK